MRTRAAWGWIAISGALLACGGCGFKGPLYLPERNATVVTHPAQATQGAGAQGAAPASQIQTPSQPGKNKGKSSPPSSPPPPPPPPQ